MNFLLTYNAILYESVRLPYPLTEHFLSLQVFFYLMNHIAVFVVFVAGSIIYRLISFGANTDFDS